jgi:hypothetical protein
MRPLVNMTDGTPQRQDGISNAKKIKIPKSKFQFPKSLPWQACSTLTV